MTASGPTCYQCGLAAPLPITAVIAGEERAFCCQGCRLACELVGASGLEAFYARRDGFGAKPVAKSDFPFQDPDFQASLSTPVPGGRAITLELEGLHCAACVWLIERILGRTAGVSEARVNLTSRRVSFQWNPEVVDLSEVVSLLGSLGYQASPYDPSGNDCRALERNRALLMRVSVAGLAALGAWFLGDPLNLGGFDASERHLQTFLSWTLLAISTPTALYVGWPFFKGAWTGLKARMLTMDATITLASAVAYMASVWAIVTGHGAVYFDCLLVLLFALLVGRSIEGAARRRVFSQAERHWRLEAPSATRLTEDGEQVVAIAAIRQGDLILVRPGERIPVDGVLEAGTGHVDESMLTGESVPVAKLVGSPLTAGTLSLEGALHVRAQRVGSETTLSQIVRWVTEADAARAPSQRLADRISAWFLPALLCVAALTFGLNLGHGLAAAVNRTISVLIVTCPCALGLATPAAIAVAMARGARDGMLFKGGTELEELGKLTHLVVDKTGTVTTGQMQVKRVSAAHGYEPAAVLGLAASLERLSEHPLARAIAAHGHAQNLAFEAVDGFEARPGHGVTGHIGGRRVTIGSVAWCAGEPPSDLPQPGADATTVYVAAAERIIGAIEVSDQLRPDAAPTLSELKQQGVETTLLSGDRQAIAATVGSKLGIPHVLAGVLPEGKRAHVLGMKAPGRVVAMVGDGVNDAPALAAADIGIAMGQGAAISASAAGVVLLGDRFGQLLDAVGLSRRTVRIIRENFMLSALYNAVVVPFAAMGLVAPQWAAILMPLSSLLVLGNALRLAR
ncbi:MAG TPA: heavy metal translocating P-type ATPase [Stenomitos sp.]